MIPQLHSDGELMERVDHLDGLIGTHYARVINKKLALGRTFFNYAELDAFLKTTSHHF